MPQPEGQAPPGFKTKRIRVWPEGNLRERISRAQTHEELDGIRQEVMARAKAGQIPPSTLRKIDTAGAAKFRELSERRIVVPGGGRRTKGGIILP
jgi:hypothetical protein